MLVPLSAVFAFAPIFKESSRIASAFHSFSPGVIFSRPIPIQASRFLCFLVRVLRCRGFVDAMVAMLASVAASLIRATPSSCNGSIQGKRVMQSLMVLQAAKLFVAVESSAVVRSRRTALTASSAKTSSVEVAPFCPLFSSLSEVSTRRLSARSAAATNGAISLSGDATNGGETTERSPRKYKKSETKKKAAKDSDQPKRPTSAYFIFMETFRKEFKAANPDVKGVTASAKAGGERWLSMSEEEKKPYFADAATRKAQYEEAMAAYKGTTGQ